MLEDNANASTFVECSPVMSLVSFDAAMIVDGMILYLSWSIDTGNMMSCSRTESDIGGY